jgi:hypothetical protein
MIRLASLFALACLGLAATALLTAPNNLAEAQPLSEDRGNAETKNRFAVLGPERPVSFHARFSLN